MGTVHHQEQEGVHNHEWAKPTEGRKGREG